MSSSPAAGSSTAPGAPWFAADLGIRGDRIAAIGNLKAAVAKTRIDATGLVVAPGFIDLLGQSEFNVLVDNRAASKITQGVTTEVTGEGTSIAPMNDRLFADMADAYRHFGVDDGLALARRLLQAPRRARAPGDQPRARSSARAALRTYVIGKDERPATPAEISRMQGLVAAAMEDGALGVSSSLQYMPDRFASTDELVALASVAARYGGVYFTHIRSESGPDHRGARRGVRRSPSGRRSRPRSGTSRPPTRPTGDGCPRCWRASRRRGPAGSTSPRTSTPTPARPTASTPACRCGRGKAATERMLARLRNPADRERIKREMDDPASPGWENQWYGSGGGDGIMLSSVLDPASGSTRG